MTTTPTHPRTSAPPRRLDSGATEFVTSLFTGLTLAGEAAADAPLDVGPRAAFQAALHGRTVLVDLRPAPARDAAGAIPTRLDPVLVGERDALAVVRRLAETSPLTLVSGDGEHARRVAARLRLLGLPWVDAVAGGIAGWRAAGLTVTLPSRPAA